MSKNKTTTTDLTTGNVTKQLVRFSFPLVISMLLQTLYGTVDTIVVGQFMGSAGLTAVNNASYLVNGMTCIGIGAGIGASVLISQYAGAGRTAELPRMIGTTVTVSSLMSIVITILMIVTATPFLRIINIPPEAEIEARNYLIVRALGMLFSFNYSVLGSVIRALGDSKRPMYFILIASVMNVVLDILFVAVFSWGAAGAAVATEISQLFTLICAIVYLKRHPEFHFSFKLADYKIHWPTAKVLFRVGMPAGLQNASIDLSFIFVNSMINVHGVIAASAVAVASKIINLGQVGISAMSTGAATMAAQNIGAAKTDRASQVVKRSLLISLATVIVIMAVIQAFPGQLIRLFTSDIGALDESIRCLRIMSLLLITICFFMNYVSIATAVGFTTFALFCFLMDGIVVRIGLSLLLSKTFGMGIDGIYWGMGLAPTLSAIISAAYFYSGRWKTRSLVDTAKE